LAKFGPNVKDKNRISPQRTQREIKIVVTLPQSLPSREGRRGRCSHRGRGVGRGEEKREDKEINGVQRVLRSGCKVKRLCIAGHFHIAKTFNGVFT
jgi:hypothetical protein